MTTPPELTVDLADLVHHEPGVRRAAAAAIRDGFAEHGLLFLANHGVDPELRDRVYDHLAAFTARPVAEKERWSAASVWYQRGWTPPNTEGAGPPDFEECWFAAPIPTDPALAIEYPEVYADNVWPDGPDSAFAQDYLQLGQQLHEAGLSLLQGVAMALELPHRTFDRRVQGGAHVLRLLRHLPLTATQLAAGARWGEAHTDSNLLTLLPGGQLRDASGAPCARPDDASGLSLRTRSGAMVRGVAPEGCIVAQVGQQLEILSGGRLLATPHVVTAPKTPGLSRMSAAHLVHLHAHEMVFPLEPFRTDATRRAYAPPVLAGTYAIKTLVDLGLAPASALDGLGYRHYDRLAKARAEGPPSS